MRHVVIGGGIAGVCCVEELCGLRPDDTVTLISSSTVLKGVDSVIRITKTIEEVLVTEKDLTALKFPNLTVLQDVVTSIDIRDKVVHLKQTGSIAFDKLCIACGARPKGLPFQHERLITLRDTQSVEDFARQLGCARRIAVVGNGGIALELVGAVRDVEVVWVLKHGHIGDAFFDLDAAEFMLHVLQKQQQQQQQQQKQQQKQQDQQPPDPAGVAAPAQIPKPPAEADDTLAAVGQAGAGGSGNGPPAAAAAAAAVKGHAAGPKWINQLPQGSLPANVRLECNALVVGVSSTPQQAPPTDRSSDTAAADTGTDSSSSSRPAEAAAAEAAGGGGWPLYLQLSNGEELGLDLVVQAIGVEPSTAWLPSELQRAADGGILVDASLESSAPGVFAAGDCCSVAPQAQARHWFQMRLWSQARLMGLQAAAGMAGAAEADGPSFSFELFTHVTRFLGKKVVLLGLYNGQKLQHEPVADVALYSRVMSEDDPVAATFVRVLLLRGRLQGAVLVGETDLEETFENLILDGLDLSSFGPELLDPDVELDHVFD